MEKNHRILVVDDNEAIHNDFRKTLGGKAEEEFDAEEAAVFGGDAKSAPRAEFELSFASQGARALELVKAAWQVGERYSVVFMDVRMPPGWDGLETASKLWEVDPDLQIVICTAYSDKSWEEMMDSLATPERVLILKKPFDPIEVLQLAHALTEKWALLQSCRFNLKELESAVSVRTRELIAANASLKSEVASHKAAMARVREQAMLLEKARDSIIVRDLDDTILFWNQAAERIYGWTASEAAGQKVLELLYKDVDNKAVIAARQELLKQGNWSGELSQKARDGRIVTAECRWTLVRDDEGRPKSILGINTDITEKKQLEAKFLRAQRMDSIGTLAGGIAHDLNNILHPITLAMDILRSELADSADSSLLDLVIANADRASSMVQQVLSFARGVEGERLPIQPNVLIHETASIVRASFPKTIVFQSSPAADAWPLLGDATQLHQVLLNLCVNARDAMPAGGALTLALENAEIDEVEAAMQMDATAGRYVVFTVTDTGTGVPEALREKIFDPFFTTKERGQGTGLGLATTLTIIRSHGGFITLDSEEGSGAAFSVFLPAADTGATTIKVADGHKGADLRGHGELILVVDDEAPILNVMCKALESFGYRVLSGIDGVDGLRAYAQNIGDVKAVITDMIMPIMGGPPLIGALKKLNPAVKVIAITGMTSDASIEAITRLGVERIISKPCTAQAILRALSEVLASSADRSGSPGGFAAPFTKEA